MGNSQAKTKVPTVEVTYCTLHEYVTDRIKAHGSKVAQVSNAIWPPSGVNTTCLGPACGALLACGL